AAAPDRPTAVLADAARTGGGGDVIDEDVSRGLDLESVAFAYLLPVSGDDGLRLPDIPDELAESYTLFADGLREARRAPGSRPSKEAMAAAEQVEAYVADCPGKPAGGPPPLPDPAVAAMLLDPDDMGAGWVQTFVPDAYELDVGPIEACLDLRLVAGEFAETALYGPDDDPIVIETVAVALPGDGSELFDRLRAGLRSCAGPPDGGGVREGDGPRHRLFDVDLADEGIGVEVHPDDPDADIDRSTRIAYARLGDVVLSVVVSEDDPAADASGTLTYGELAVTKVAAGSGEGGAGDE
ncbi:MAG: hypothetical protein ACLFXM_10225, partial [Acidimicrobiia bacterium]